MKDEQRIMKTLQDFGELPTGRLAAICGINYYRALPILQKMWENNLIAPTHHANHTTWKLKGELNGDEKSPDASIKK